MSDEKKTLTLDDVFGEIKKGNKKVEASINGLEKKIDENQLLLMNYIKSNDAIVQGLKNETDQVTTKLTKTEATVTELEDRVSTLTDELEQVRKTGETQQESLNRLEANEKERIEEKKKANIQPGQILTAFRIETVNRINKTRPRAVLVKLSTPTVKYEIYKHVKALKDHDTWKKIYISDDLTREVAEERKVLRTLAAFARDKGHRATVRGGALILDDMKYTYNEIDNLPAGIDMESAKMIELEDGIAFQSHYAFLSSMYMVEIDIDGTPIHCAEQAYWLKIARLAGDKRAEKRVRDANNGYEAKRAGHSIKMTREIEQQKEDIMADVQDQKYEQNPELKSKLMVTEGNLYEATLDKFFSCGLLLWQKSKIGTAEQTGLNRLGLKLMDLRGKYQMEAA